MKTFIIDLDGIEPVIFKDLMGFVLTVGLNFRKLDKKTQSGTGRTLFVEADTEKEKESLVNFLENIGLCSFFIVHEDLKTSSHDEFIGIFSPVKSDVNEYYLDNTSGKKFSIVR